MRKNRQKTGKGQIFLIMLCCYMAAAAIMLNACKTAGPQEQWLGQDEKAVTFIWMSDTQRYSEDAPEIFDSMTQWIAAQREALNIQYVLHTGDVVDDYDDMRQWENANKALAVLQDKVALFVLAGNHDIDGENQRYDNYLHFLGEEHFDHLPTFGGAYRGGRGRYDLVEIDDVPAILISVGFGVGRGVDDQAILWMNEVLQAHADRYAILCVHSYFNADLSFTPDGAVLFEQVVKKNANIKLVLCGHRYNAARKMTELDDNGDGIPDRKVYQLIVNYQAEPQGGAGYLCLLAFSSAKRSIGIKTYSPYLEDYNYYASGTDREEFILPWDYLPQ